jgi:hypothetical protein
MAGEAKAFRALTLLIAVCEQAVESLTAVDPPVDPALVEHAQRLRDLALVEVRYGAFARGNSMSDGTPNTQPAPSTTPDG